MALILASGVIIAMFDRKWRYLGYQNMLKTDGIYILKTIYKKLALPTIFGYLLSNTMVKTPLFRYFQIKRR